jgi:tRNA A-37 threonylcarbamoyl transferase component Bud32
MSDTFLNNRKNLLAKLGITNTNKINFFTQGANGAIFKYYNNGNNQPPKILKFGLGPQNNKNNTMDKAIARNKREYNTIASVHKKLVKRGGEIFVPAVHGFASNEKLGTLSMMNFVKGETLREVSEFISDPEDYKKIYKKLKQIVKVLGELGIVHGDLHDGNIMVEIEFDNNDSVKDFNIKLIDFGRSRKKGTVLKNVFLHPRSAYIGCKNGSRVCHIPYGYHNNSRLPTMISNEAAIKILFAKKKYSISRARLVNPNNKTPIRPPKKLPPLTPPQNRERVLKASRIIKNKNTRKSVNFGRSF